ncbi:hypothetical protein DBR42_04565 [Pelomonas sp. HMWF004]|nr:hypothetical protein DBR42_04565 [Pelomonas sp. HMWF004]
MQTGQLRLNARNIVVRTVNDLPSVAHELREVDGCVCMRDALTGMCSGHTRWATAVQAAPIEIAWSWAEIQPGLIALRDPMSILSNVLILDAEGHALERAQRMLHLNNLVYQLDWRRAARRSDGYSRAVFASAAH